MIEVDVDCIGEQTDAIKKIRYGKYIFVITDILFKNQLGTKYLTVECMEEDAFIQDMEDAQESEPLT